MTPAVLEVVAKKLEAGEAAPAILASIPPTERAAVLAWGAIELSFIVLEASASDAFGPSTWQAEMGAAARRLARLLVAVWTDPATPHPYDAVSGQGAPKPPEGGPR
jgi:hypothetical protein